MTDKDEYQPSLIEQVAQNAAAFAGTMRSTDPGLPTEVVVRATMVFTDHYAAYWIRQAELGRVSFMDTDLPDDEGDEND